MSKHYFLILASISGFATTLVSHPSIALSQTARVIPDGTTDTSITGSHQCSTNCSISGESRSQIGNNLFHSFDEFSISEGVTVTFRDDGASNIFTRVTGGGTSIINGTLAVTGSGQANFFLINPQGITFGNQAALLTSGSFVASTAEQLIFTDDTKFDAFESTPPLLTVSTPAKFGFGQNFGRIINRSQAQLNGATNSLNTPAGLQVTNGNTLSLIGNSVHLDNGNLTASGGRIEISSVDSNTQVSLLPSFQADYKETKVFQDVSLTGSSLIDVSGNGGELNIQGRNIIIRDFSAIVNTNTEASAAGEITLIADSAIEVSGIGILASTFPFSTGNSADVTISAREFRLAEGGLISGGTNGQGNGGNITINATDLVEIKGSSAFSTSLITTATEGAGAGGTLTINTRQLNILDGAGIEAASYGPGRGGDIFINARQQVNVSGTGSNTAERAIGSGIATSSGLEGFLPLPSTGASGNLTITTRNLAVDNGAQVSVSSSGRGDSGNLEVDAQTVRLDNGAQLTAAAAFGNGGNIRLENLETLLLRRGSSISTQAGSANGTNNGLGNGGNINIEADYIVTNPFEDSDIVAKAVRGQGGNIEISARGLYGIAERRAIANNGTNDIDASSDFGLSGTIDINQRFEETSQGIVNLSDRTLETAAAVGQGCQVSGNRLVVTRRGGLPTNPTETVEIASPLVDLGENISTENISTENILTTERSSTITNHEALEKTVEGIEQAADWSEASGWHRNENGQVVFTTRPRSSSLTELSPGSHCTGQNLRSSGLGA